MSPEDAELVGLIDNELDEDAKRRVLGRPGAHFARMWNAAGPMIDFAPAINAMEPK